MDCSDNSTGSVAIRTLFITYDDWENKNSVTRWLQHVAQYLDHESLGTSFTSTRVTSYTLEVNSPRKTITKDESCLATKLTISRFVLKFTKNARGLSPGLKTPTIYFSSSFVDKRIRWPDVNKTAEPAGISISVTSSGLPSLAIKIFLES
jgi:hypothetical protein